MKIKSVDVMSFGKTMGVVYALLALVIGGLYGLLAFMGMLFSGEPFLGLGLLIGSVTIAPLIYGVVGGLMGLLMAFFYNYASKYTGGIQLNFESDKEILNY